MDRNDLGCFNFLDERYVDKYLDWFDDLFDERYGNMDRNFDNLLNCFSRDRYFSDTLNLDNFLFI